MTKYRVTLLAALAAILCVAALSGCRSAHTTSAILYIEQEQYQKAIDVIDEGLQYNPDDPEGFYYQGEAYSRMAQQAIDENDFLLARESFKLAYGKYTTARDMDSENMADMVAEALDINFQNTLREGVSNAQQQNYEQAEGFYRLAFAALPDSLKSVKNLAGMKIQQAEISPADSASMLRNEALDLLDQVLIDNPDAFRLLSDKGYVLTQLGRTEEAQAIYDDLLREHGNDPELLLDVVGLYGKQKRYSDAGNLYLQVADIYLNDTDSANDNSLKGLYAEAGFNFQMAGDFPKSLDAYGSANEQATDDTQLMLNRVQLYLLYGQQLLTEAAGLTVDDPARAVEVETQAKVVLQRGVEVGNALVTIDPNNADGFYILANTQALLGDTTAAEENMKSYEELSGIQ